jgi:hypothetical protein
MKPKTEENLYAILVFLSLPLTVGAFIMFLAFEKVGINA